MSREERVAIANGIICILDTIKMLINPQVMKDKELIEATMEYIKSTENMLMELNQDDQRTKRTLI